MKVCNTCKVEKDLLYFSVNKARKDGLDSKCKDCRKLYRNKRKDRYITYQKKYRRDNKEKVTEYNLEYVKNNKSKIAY